MKKWKNLEDKILDKVYVYEAKLTIAEILVRLGAVLVLGAVIIFVIQVLITTLIEQKTLDLLEIFNEDFEIIKTYFQDVVQIFFEELPKKTVLILLIAVTLFIIGFLTFIKNFARIKRKLKALLGHWL